MMKAMLFEGPDLEEVLAEARLCFGPNMEIEAANRVRRGGVFGFFASEWYEVWARSNQAKTNAAIALLQQEEEELRDAGLDTAGLGSGPAGDDPDSFQTMVRHALEDQFTATPVIDSLDDAMERFFGDETPVPGGSAITPPAGSGGTAVKVAPAAATTTVAPSASPVGVVDVLTRPNPPQQELNDVTVPAVVALEDAPRGSSVFSTERAPRTGLLWAMLDRLDDAPMPPPLPTSGIIAFVGNASDSLEAVQTIGRNSGLWTTDIAILSHQQRIDSVPAWLIVNDLTDLEARAARWRQRDGVTALIIDQDLDNGARDWVTDALLAATPEQTRLVADAWRLPADVGRVAAKIGGVDAVELVSVAGSTEPLAMLDLNIPVGSILGRTATPELLAAVWLENRHCA